MKQTYSATTNDTRARNSGFAAWPDFRPETDLHYCNSSPLFPNNLIYKSAITSLLCTSRESIPMEKRHTFLEEPIFMQDHQCIGEQDRRLEQVHNRERHLSCPRLLRRCLLLNLVNLRRVLCLQQHLVFVSTVNRPIQQETLLKLLRQEPQSMRLALLFVDSNLCPPAPPFLLRVGLDSTYRYVDIVLREVDLGCERAF
jgi:hypothetical protein